MCMGKVFFPLYQMMINQDAVQGISSEATEFFDSFLNEGIILKSLKESAEEKNDCSGIPQGIHHEHGGCGV